MNQSLDQNKKAMSFVEDKIPFIKIFSQDFLGHFGLEYFSYMRFYNDGSISRVTTNESWHPQFFINHIYDDEKMFQKRE